MSVSRHLRRALAAAAVAVTAATAGGLATFGAQAAIGSSITGAAFDDLDRDGVRDAGEGAFADQLLYLTRDGAYVTNTRTAADGSYRFDGLADGSYAVEIAAGSWSALRHDWVPTTTGSLRPTRAVTVPTSAPVDFGLRAIVRSTDEAAPLSTYTGPSGLQVASYDDAVSARTIHDAVVNGLVAGEAPTVTVRFDLVAGNSTSYGGTGSSFRSTVYTSYLDWIDVGDLTLGHEYGHAWSLYYANVVLADPSLSGYLQARHLTGDPRLGSTHAWDPRELIAEDYRQLFGSATARLGSQENVDIPRAADVAGLRDYLAGPFMAGGAGATGLQVTAVRVAPQVVKTSGTVSFSLSADASVTVRILDGRGVAVRTVVASVPAKAGTVSFTWDRKNDAGQRVKAGTYTASVSATAGGATSGGAATFSVG